MKPAPIPKEERERQAALERYDILDTPAEQVFDELTRVAAKLCDVPIALVSLVDGERQWFKSRHGLDAESTPRDISFCGHAVAAREFLVVSDASRDERFADNPLVSGEPNIRFYAGTPLIAPDGHALGTLCVIDRRPRKLSKEQLELLRALGRQAMSQIELRRRLAREQSAGRSLLDAVALQRAVLDAANFAIISTDTEGTITTFNLAAQRWLGYAASEVVHQMTPDAFLDRDEVRARATELSEEKGRPVTGIEIFVSEARRGVPEERQWTAVSKDGRRFPVQLSITAIEDEAGSVVGFLGIARDLSERESIKEDRQRLEEEKAQFFSLNLDLLCIAGFDGYFKQLNPAWQKTLGYTMEELLARPFIELVHEDDRERTQTEAGRLAQGDQTVEFENRYRAKDGSYRWLLWTAAADPARETIYAVARDVTGRKHIEEMKNEFISTVSHELRTPLTSIRGSLGLVVSGTLGELPEPVRPLLNIAANNCERLVRLVNDILDVEKIESGRSTFQRKRVAIGDVVRQAIESNRSFAAKFEVSLDLEDDLGDAWVSGDPDRLTQVVDNLLSNAAKFSPTGETVTVRLTRHDGWIRVSVRDRGPGIPEEFAGRIFDKFAQADSSDRREKGGTGLGLAIVKAIAEKHEGRVHFETKRDAGTVFHVDLPELAAASEVALSSTVPGQRPRVLICEDDPDIASLLRLILEKGGYRADVAYDPEAAKARLAECEYDAMTLDLSFPGQNGMTLVEELRAHEPTRALPIVVVSATADETKETLSGTAFGVADWLSKPVDEERLLDAVRQATRGISGRARILHVEDEDDLVEVVSSLFGEEASLVQARSLASARERLSRERYDLILLDLGLDDGSGLELLEEIQELRTPPPVIVFSAREVEADTLRDVEAALVKSRTSDTDLLEAVRNALGRAQSKRL